MAPRAGNGTGQAGENTSSRTKISRSPCFELRRCGCLEGIAQIGEKILRSGDSSMLKENIGIIGAGKIGSAIMRGVIQSGLVQKDRVIASDVSEPLRQNVANELHLKVTASNVQAGEFAEVVILWGKL